MAFVSKEKLEVISPLVKTVLKKYKLKGTLSVHDNRTIVLSISSGSIDFLEEYRILTGKECTDFRLDFYNLLDYSKELQPFLNDITEALHGPDYFDNKQYGTKYHDCSHYISISVS